MKPFLVAVATFALLVPTAATAAPVATKAYSERVVIGHSQKGRPIYAWRLGDPTAKKTVLLLAAMHGNEKGATRTLRNLRDGAPIHGVDMWVVPVVNPDGYAKSSRRNGRGVDLNRNFSVSWRKITGATNSGKKAFSERESRAVAKFTAKIDPDYTVSFHQPLDGVDVRDTRNTAWSKRLAKGLKLPTKALDCDSSCHGTFSMWFLKHQEHGAVVTVELRAHPSKTYLTKTATKAILSSVHATR